MYPHHIIDMIGYGLHLLQRGAYVVVCLALGVEPALDLTNEERVL